MLIVLIAWSVQWHVDLSSIIRGRGPIIESAYIPREERKRGGRRSRGERGRKGSPTRSSVDVV